MDTVISNIYKILKQKYACNNSTRGLPGKQAMGKLGI